MSSFPSSPGTVFSTRIEVGRWCEGAPDALGRLAIRFSPLVRYRIQASPHHMKVTRHSTVDDIEQEVWTRVLRSGNGSFQPTERRHAFASWLGQLVDSTLIDLIRHQEAQKRGGGRVPDALDSLAEMQEMRRPGQRSLLSPSAEVRLSEFEEVARRVLSERELKAWTWTVLEGYSPTEAAMGLSTSPSAVRGLLLRSRSKLQEALTRKST